MRIDRDGETVYEDGTTTANLARTVEEPVSSYTRHNSVPELSVLLAGTSLVPDDGSTLGERHRLDHARRGRNAVTEG